MTQPLEAGSASCRVIFVVQVPPRGGIPDSSWAKKGVCDRLLSARLIFSVRPPVQSHVWN
jgi:hypothetical protein